MILNRLAGIMAIWTDVLSEVQEAEEEYLSDLCLINVVS